MKISYYLERSLLKLLKTKSIDEIYVIEIIDEIGTCKGTFYKYYRDKYDLLFHCFQDCIYKDIPETSENWNEFISRLLSVFKENAAVVLNSFVSADMNSVRHYNEGVIRQFIVSERERRGVETAGATYEYALNMYAVYVTDIIMDWLRHGCKTPTEETVALINATMPVILCS